MTGTESLTESTMLTGRGNILIPSTDIFTDETLSDDCTSVHRWLFWLANQNEEYNEDEINKPASPKGGFYIPGNSDKDWLVVNVGTTGEHRDYISNGNLEVSGAQQYAEVGIIDSENHTPQVIFRTTRTPVHKSGAASWALSPNKSAKCDILLHDGWKQVRDEDFSFYDYYQNIKHNVPQKELDFIKSSNEVLRQKFSDFVEYIQV